MAYTPQTWSDGSSGGTPITAARLNNIEGGIASLGLSVVATVSASATLAVGKFTPVDATGAARTMTLPTSAGDGVTIGVEKVDASTNVVSVTGNIRGVPATTITLPWQHETLLLRADSAGSWWPVAGHKTKAALDAAYGPTGGFADTIIPTRHGAVGDYTGRLGTTGTGTDNRAAIQAALNAATNQPGSAYYDYLTRRSTVVELPPGDYLISAPSGGSPSLTIPAGVTLDTTKATLYFDYPATATAHWCGIQVGQYGQLHIGKVFNSGRVAAPDTAKVYDAIRLWQTDNNSRVLGYHDSEINGFQGAGIRGVGAWIVFVGGIRFTGLSYGYVASNYGDGTLGGALSNPSGGGTNRAHTDLRISDCQFVNISNGGILGVVQGNTGAINTVDFVTSGLTVDILHCVFESIGWYALDLVNAFTVSTVGCAFEECGKTGGGMLHLDTVRTFAQVSTRVNLGGRSGVPSPSGSITPNPAYFIEQSNLISCSTSGLFVHNTYVTGMLFANSAAASWRTDPPYCDANDFAAGAMYNGRAFSISGDYIRPFALGTTGRLWVDASGSLRFKYGTPAADADGSRIAAYTGCKLKRTNDTGTIFTTGGSAVAVPFDQEAWDTDAFHDTVTNNTRITIPTGLDGKYELKGQITLGASATGRRIITVRKNGTTTIYRNDKAALSSGDTSLVLTLEDAAVATDYYEMLVFQDSGSSLNSDISVAPIEFSCRRVG